MLCPRCGYYTEKEDTVCPECGETEKKMSDYKKAVEAELRAIEAGDFNFPGIGFPKKGGDQ